MLILEHIEVVHPVDKKHAAAKPAKSQGTEQLSKKILLGMQISRKPKHVCMEYTHVDKKCDLCKKHGGM